MKRRELSATNRRQSEESTIVKTEEQREKTPMDVVIEIETLRVRLGIKKQDLSAAAHIKPEMYSYILRRARDGESLPEVRIKALRRALRRFEKKSA
jgi:hypothetical protein